MAIDRTGISSLDAGASDITYTGNEGPKSPQQMQQQQMQQMQMASLTQEYKEYVRQQQDVAPHQILSFKDWYRMVYEASRAGQAGGGRINAAQCYPNPEKEFISETQLEENYPGLARGEVGRGFGSPQALTTLEMQADAMVQAGVAATKEEAMKLLLQKKMYGVQQAPEEGLAYGGTAHPTYTQSRRQRINAAGGGIMGSNAGSMLVAPTADGSRPGYGWADAWEVIKNVGQTIMPGGDPGYINLYNRGDPSDPTKGGQGINLAGPLAGGAAAYALQQKYLADQPPFPKDLTKIDFQTAEEVMADEAQRFKLEERFWKQAEGGRIGAFNGGIQGLMPRRGRVMYPGGYAGTPTHEDFQKFMKDMQGMEQGINREELLKSREKYKKFYYGDFLMPFESLFNQLIKCQSNISSCQTDPVSAAIKNAAFECLHSYDPKTEQNLSKDEYEALKSLLSEEDIVIQKSDKGNSVVILNKLDYITRMNKLLADTSKFKKLNIDSGKDYNFIINQRTPHINISQEHQEQSRHAELTL